MPARATSGYGPAMPTNEEITRFHEDPVREIYERMFRAHGLLPDAER